MGEWQHFAHGADIGIRGQGPTLEAAFVAAAEALTAVVTDLERVRPVESRVIECEAGDRELLLYEWLNALVFHMSTERLLFSSFDLQIEDLRLRAVVRGEPVDVTRHQPVVEVKGATLTELAVRQDAADRWIAQCVLDV